MVADSNAIVDPGTVVIVAVHAAMADNAVAATSRPDRLALGTQAGAVERLQETHELDVLVL